MPAPAPTTKTGSAFGSGSRGSGVSIRVTGAVDVVFSGAAAGAEVFASGAGGAAFFGFLFDALDFRGGCAACAVAGSPSRRSATRSRPIDSHFIAHGRHRQHTHVEPRVLH